jgi:hypothetical protein
MWWELTRPDFDNVSTVPKEIIFPNIFDAEAEFSTIYTYGYMKVSVIIGEDLENDLEISVSGNIAKFVKIVDLKQMKNAGQYTFGVDFVEAEFVFTQPGTRFGNITIHNADGDYQIIDVQLTVSLWAMVKKSGLYIAIILITSTSIAFISIRKIIDKTKKSPIIFCEDGFDCFCDSFGENCQKIPIEQ